jgi:hypothetical protein
LIVGSKAAAMAALMVEITAAIARALVKYKLLEPSTKASVLDNETLSPLVIQPSSP